MKKIKGISLSISDEEVSYNPGYIIRDSPFILIQEFVDGNSSLRDEIINLIKKIPDPNKHETYIGKKELKLLKQAWRKIDG